MSNTQSKIDSLKELNSRLISEIGKLRKENTEFKTKIIVKQLGCVKDHETQVYKQTNEQERRNRFEVELRDERRNRVLCIKCVKVWKGKKENVT
ncbi:5543_t:CDS:2 [Diversispora eburnea]|uniref:5543_t:CDS:1 n=1 Tax=Diversispora eburnea TaxID=1213867 RepID=A0A9N8YNC8_9GLOM|nr:5543_t:CDS:2 [Diversispora eburnea]